MKLKDKIFMTGMIMHKFQDALWVSVLHTALGIIFCAEIVEHVFSVRKYQTKYNKMTKKIIKCVNKLSIVDKIQSHLYNSNNTIRGGKNIEQINTNDTR